jgi:hypothetical protein
LLSCRVGSGPTVQAEPTYDLTLEPAQQTIYGHQGQTVSADLSVVLTTGGDHQGQGAQGWSLSISSEDCEIVSATTDGTAGEGADFAETQLTREVREDPEGNPDAGCPDGEHGVVSAVVLKFGKPPVYLQRMGTATVLAMDVQSTKTVEVEGPVTGAIEWIDLCEGLGEGVDNVVTVEGNTTSLCCMQGAMFTFVAVERLFIRGNPNNDAKVDICDPIWIINELFLDGPPTLCQEAADANDDGTIDTSDAVYLIEYQFLGKSAPPAPFPECGRDPAADGLPCESFPMCE